MFSLGWTFFFVFSKNKLFYRAFNHPFVTGHTIHVSMFYKDLGRTSYGDSWPSLAFSRGVKMQLSLLPGETSRCFWSSCEGEWNLILKFNTWSKKFQESIGYKTLFNLLLPFLGDSSNTSAGICVPKHLSPNYLQMWNYQGVGVHVRLDFVRTFLLQLYTLCLSQTCKPFEAKQPS